MLSKPEDTQSKVKAERMQPQKRETFEESLKQTFEEPVQEEEETDKVVEDKPERKAEIQPVMETRLSENQFIVENLGMLYATWTGTVRIPKEALSQWGKKVKEVEIEAADGKKARCKVVFMESSERNLIEVPDKVQQTLGVKKGELVKVKPCK